MRTARFRNFSKLTIDSHHADVLVIGGGHAGCEAAHASARTGAQTVLVTQKTSTIGEMSCNPSIGGVGKGTLVREVDALGGLMGKIADEAGIHFKVLNRSKGPAVQGPRAQMDRDQYKANMLHELTHNTPNLSIHKGSVEDFIVEGDQVKGILLQNGEELRARKVVLTTGTFLRGSVHIGSESRPAGRYRRNGIDVEPSATTLAKRLKHHEFPIGRLRTGTPPRLAFDSIDFSVLEK